MVLHEYKPPKCFPNTSLTIRLSRPLIRTDTSQDREPTKRYIVSITSCRDTERRCVPLHPLPAVETPIDAAYHCIRCQLSRHRETVHISTLAINGTPWKLPRFHTRSPWDSMKATRLPHARCPHQFSVTVLHTNVADKNRYYTSSHNVSEQTKTVLA